MNSFIDPGWFIADYFGAGLDRDSFTNLGFGGAFLIGNHFKNFNPFQKFVF